MQLNKKESRNHGITHKTSAGGLCYIVLIDTGKPRNKLPQLT